MQNAHLRLGLLEYHRMTEKTSTRIRLRVDRYVGEDEQSHLISVFGNDSDVGAITAAVHEKATFTLTFRKRPEFPSGMTSGLRTTMPSWVVRRKLELGVGLAGGERFQRSGG
jgi:hypothetical protein